MLNESIIVALFQGQFKSTVQCLTCHCKSRTFETFMYLSLPLASTSKCSLQVQLYLMVYTPASGFVFYYSVSASVGLSPVVLQGGEAHRQQQGVLQEV